MRQTLSSRGIVQRFAVEGESSASPQVSQLIEPLRNMMSQLAVPLPAEAVGSGAKWESGRKVPTMGTHIDQKVTYFVQKLSERSLEVEPSTRRASYDPSSHVGRPVHPP